MGNQLLDQYSILHYATGVIAFFWGVPPLYFFLAHVAFEVVENTGPGMAFINKFGYWPGGKPRVDTFANIVGDNLAALLGYYCAYKLDDWGKTYKWYT